MKGLCLMTHDQQSTLGQHIRMVVIRTVCAAWTEELNDL